MGEILKGKAAVITGSGGGIGRCVALAMAAEGAGVVVNDIGVGADGIKLADKTVAEIKKAGGKAAASYDSVTTVISGQKIIDTAIANFGRVDILVNCAGNFRGTSTLDISQEEWDATLDLHIGGHFSCAKAAAKALVEALLMAIASQERREYYQLRFPRRFPVFWRIRFILCRRQSRDFRFYHRSFYGTEEIRYPG